MTRLTLSGTIAACFLIAAIPAVGSADTVFLDDFSDGNLQDDDPVSWTGGEIQSGDLVLSGVGVPTSTVIGLDIPGISVRTVFELVDGIGIGIAARSARRAAYVGYLVVDPVDNTVIQAGISTGENLCCTDLVDPVEVPFDPRQEDIAMQLDMFSDNIRLWVWPAGETKPAAPLLEANDSRLVSGTVWPWVAGEDWDQPNPQDVATGRFRFVHVADSHIPEPSTGLISVLGLMSLFVWRRKTYELSRV